MQEKAILKGFILLSICLCNVRVACSQEADFSPIKMINPNQSYADKDEVFVNLENNNYKARLIELGSGDVFYNLSNATDRFVQSNVKSSWEDFKLLINTMEPNDFIYISIANKMAGMGFFDLAYLASSKITDKDIGGISIDAMQRFYFPRKKLKLEDELFLAEIYSNIIYNDQSSEATNELLKNQTLLANSDYANYLVALGSYKSSMFSRASKYINLAIIQNPTNLNYQKLKAEIAAENDDSIEALKTVDYLKKQNLISYEYEQKVLSLEQNVLQKLEKNEAEKQYHLGYYYHLENDDSRAIRTLQAALVSRKKINKCKIYALMSEVYLKMNEFEKASDTANKACKLNKNYPMALMVLGDLAYRNNEFSKALDYYKKAASQDKKSYKPLVKQAMAYQKLSNSKKAKEIYSKVLKTYFNSWEAYYNVALMEKDKELIYLKKAVAINPLFEAGWIELARFEIEKNNFTIAQKYLANAFYIDENDFRYYYYQGVVNTNLGDLIQASYNFKKCLKLNPKHQEAQKALDKIINGETTNMKQENI